MKISSIKVTSVIQHDVEESQVQEQQQSAGKVKKTGGKRFGYNYIFIKSYKESKKNDVVKCLYIKSLTNFGFCVIKEGCYGDTKDKQGRDIIDRLKWQKHLHELLQDKLLMPRFHGYFEENGNYYLVIGHVKGKALQKVMSDAQKKDIRQSLISGDKVGIRFLDYLLQITDILQKLHGEGIVHRDATPNNYMITHSGKVAVIDMEMCYSLPLQFPTPAFQLGTVGYMSPQQEKTEVPTVAEDIYALGAIMLQMWSGISPNKLTSEPIDKLKTKIAFFIPDQAIADLVTQCLLPQDDQRPDAASIRKVLQQYKTDLSNKKNRPICKPALYTPKDIMVTVQEMIHTMASPLLTDDDKGWFSNNLKTPTEEEKHKLRKMWYGSYQYGVSGVIYFMAQASKAGIDISPALPFIQKGLDLIYQKYMSRIEKAKAGLTAGSDGIAAVLSSAIQADLLEATDEHITWINLLLEKSTDSINITKGMAGQGLANLRSIPFINPQVLEERLLQYGQKIVEKQEKDGSWTHGYSKAKFLRKKKRKINKGFQEGVAGIVYFLLSLKQQYPNNYMVDDSAQKGLEWLMRNAIHKRGNIYWRSTRRKDIGYSWAEGVIGIALTFIKAYEVIGEKKYKDHAVKTLQSLPSKITNSNIGQLNGLSGIGEAYLEAYRVFQEPVWLQRADWIAQVIMQLKKTHPKYGPYWLVEHERQPVPGFMIGNSGVLHFLLRYCHPDKIQPPLGL